MADISKIKTLDGKIHNIKDTTARAGLIPKLEVTSAEYAALEQAGLIDPDTYYIITDDNSNPVTQADLATKVNKSELSGIFQTGSTCTESDGIPSGWFFYLDNVLVRAITSIPNGATFVSGTNYETVSAGGLNELVSATSNSKVKVSYVKITSGTVTSQARVGYITADKDEFICWTHVSTNGFIASCYIEKPESKSTAAWCSYNYTSTSLSSGTNVCCYFLYYDT